MLLPSLRRRLRGRCTCSVPGSFCYKIRRACFCVVLRQKRRRTPVGVLRLGNLCLFLVMAVFGAQKPCEACAFDFGHRRCGGDERLDLGFDGGIC